MTFRERRGRIKSVIICKEEPVLKKLQDRIDRFCILHPRFGIPGLMRYIIIGNVLIYLLAKFSSMGFGIFNLLSFRLDMVLHGEIWRILTFAFIPLSTSLLSLILSCFFYYWIGTTLEQEWGTAKFTIYYLSGAVLTMLGVTLASLFFHVSYSLMGLSYVNLAMFMAFAVLYPDAQVLLFYIIPIKCKWLAYADMGIFLIDILTSAMAHNWANILISVIAILNFFVFFASDLAGFFHLTQTRNRQAAHFQNTAREAKHAEKVQKEKDYRFKCTVCGRTDRDHPELQFRYCSRCAGYHCYCSDHIFNHTHITEEEDKLMGET